MRHGPTAWRSSARPPRWAWVQLAIACVPAVTTTGMASGASGRSNGVFST
jgi:hypothetical protein